MIINGQSKRKFINKKWLIVNQNDKWYKQSETDAEVCLWIIKPTRKCIRNHVWMSHITHMNESCRSHDRSKQFSMPFVRKNRRWRRKHAKCKRQQKPLHCTRFERIYAHINMYMYKYIYIYVCIYMYMYIYVYTYIYIYINIHILMYTHTCICIYIHTHIYIYIYIQIYMCIFTWINIHVHKYICIICICVYIYIHICIYIYIFVALARCHHC